MLFVPLPLFAALFLTFLFGRMVLTRDMTLRAHQLFAGLIVLYAAQSLLASLRWGYQIHGAAIWTAILAPVLPVLAHLAYSALSGRRGYQQLWPIAVVFANWVALAILPAIADPLILVTYFLFGGLLLRGCWRGADQLTLSSINGARDILMAMCLTGIALIASGLTDIYVIYDFIRNEGRNAGLVLTLVQTVFVVVIGISAALGRVASEPAAPHPDVQIPKITQADEDILARLEDLLTQERLHLNDDLSLRRLARRLGLSDRQVSNAINRVKDMSVSQYVNTFRIQDICDLLSQTEDSILNVSLAAGFASKSNFNREFSRITGKTPSQWRAGNRSGRKSSTAR